MVAVAEVVEEHFHHCRQVVQSGTRRANERPGAALVVHQKLEISVHEAAMPVSSAVRVHGLQFETLSTNRHDPRPENVAMHLESQGFRIVIALLDRMDARKTDRHVAHGGVEVVHVFFFLSFVFSKKRCLLRASANSSCFGLFFLSFFFLSLFFFFFFVVVWVVLSSKRRFSPGDLGDSSNGSSDAKKKLSGPPPLVARMMRRLEPHCSYEHSQL